LDFQYRVLRKLKKTADNFDVGKRREKGREQKARCGMEARYHFDAFVAIIVLTQLSLSTDRCLTAPITIYRDYAANVPVIVVEINLNHSDAYVTGTMATGGSGHSETWSSLIHRTQPLVAVTGTYFDVASKIPIGDLFIGGRLAHFGGKGSALCIDSSNRARFITVPQDRRVDWSTYDFVIRSGPRLVNAGVAQVHMRAEGFHDTALTRPTARLGVGLTKHNTLLLVSTRKAVTLQRWAQALKATGAWDAMNLDAGPCMALYVDGRTVIRPRTRLTNLMLVYDGRPEGRYARRIACQAVRSAQATLPDAVMSSIARQIANPAAPGPPQQRPRDETPVLRLESNAAIEARRELP